MSDPRFARLKTDPRFRKPKQKALKVELDDRFKDVLESEEFGGSGASKGKGKARVDKRGRPVAQTHHQDQLKRFYRLRSPEADAEGGGEGAEKAFVDYARGEGALSSSGSEEESEAEEDELEVGVKKRLPIHAFDEDEDDESVSEESDEDEDHLQIDLSENDDDVPSAFPPEADDDEDEEDEEPSVPPTKRVAAVNLDWDNLRATDLYAVFNSFLSPSPETSKDGAAGKGKLVSVKIYPSEFGKERMAKEEQEGPGGGLFISRPGEGKTKGKNKRKEELVRQKDLEPDSGDESEGEENDDDLESGSEDGDDFEEESEDEVYDDDEDEDASDAPPRKSNARPKKEIDGLEIISDVESDAGSEDIDMDQLRKYQLERLRYFYAIATFSSVEAAEHVMDECNGTEFERTANIMDLSYVPEDMDFADDEVKDEATKEAKSYKGNDFVTDALRHSKVKLTWDQDDPNRIKMTRRTLTREEIEEEDFKNLVASSGSDSDSEDEAPNHAEGSKKVDVGGSKTKTKSKKAAMKERTEKLRSLLLAGDDDGDGDVWGKAGTAWADELEDIKAGRDTKRKQKGKKTKAEGDMEITFRPGLSVAKANEKGDVDEEDLTTLERYQLRMKEKRQRKKEKMELKKGLKGVDSDGNAESDDDDVPRGGKDDFFGSDEEEEEQVPTIKDKKKSKEDKTKIKSAPIPTPILEEEDLLAIVSGGEEEDTNFSMKDILRAEKDGKKKRNRRKKNNRNEEEREAEKALGPEGWKIDVKDDRFKALHQEPEFAIDPSNPHFTKTKAMKDLLAERTRRRNEDTSAPKDKVIPSSSNGNANAGAGGGGKDLNALVESVKRKMDQGGRKRKRSRK